jgi:hypothetical protein
VTLRCRYCGTPVTLAEPETLAAFCERNIGAVWCDGCWLRLASLKQAMAFMGKRG